MPSGATDPRVHLTLSFPFLFFLSQVSSAVSSATSSRDSRPRDSRFGGRENGEGCTAEAAAAAAAAAPSETSHSLFSRLSSSLPAQLVGLKMLVPTKEQAEGHYADLSVSGREKDARRAS